MRVIRFACAIVMTSAVAACGAAQSAQSAAPSRPFTGDGLPHLAGQAVTCAGPHQKTFAFEVREVTIDLGMATKFMAWTYNGTVPGPVIEACEGDEVTITMSNHAGLAHGLDSHALRTSMMHFGPVEPDKSMTIKSVAATPGVFMYHCADGPATDLHVKSGLYGAMIVYPRAQALAGARELVVVESGVFGERESDGVIPGADPDRVRRNDPTLMMFNGRLGHAPLSVEPGDLVRAYVVNVGPGVSAIHVMGTILDTVYDGAAQVHTVQTYGIPPGSGAIVEFRIPETGTYGLVDHDRLAYLGYGMVIPFDASGGHVHESM
jgi:nitrite reductase (NO-forming)